MNFSDRKRITAKINGILSEEYLELEPVSKFKAKDLIECLMILSEMKGTRLEIIAAREKMRGELKILVEQNGETRRQKERRKESAQKVDPEIENQPEKGFSC